MKKMLETISASAAGLLLAAASACAAERAVSCDDIFKTAVAVWHMAGLKDASGKDELRIVGAVTPGVELEGKDLKDSLESGNDGLVARMEGGYLDAGQGTGGMLNLTGSALTVSVRLRSPSGAWGKPLFSKHGGHDRLVYNLFSFDSAIGFELGTRDTPGMTQVLAPLARIGRQDWHDVICRYDGTNLQMFVDGVLMSEASVGGPLRQGNTEPCLIGAESAGGGIKAGWKGLIDHAAIWSRALSDAEIERLSGGAARVAARKVDYSKEPPAFECKTIDKPYVHLPINFDAPEARLSVKIDGEQQNLLITIRLAQGKPDWNGMISVQQWMGKKLTIVPKEPLAESGWIRNVKLSDHLPDEESVYKEKYRPQFHFAARRGWINDVNGPFYLNGVYHLPFQHAPWRLQDSGNISEKYWGHAISKDLIHWEEIGPVLSFSKLGCAWSGSSAIDWYNTAGLVKDPVKDKDGRLKNPAVVAFANHGGYKREDFVVAFSYSLDSGYNWTYYPGNPVIPAHSMGNRDPHVLWYEDKADPANSHWALALYSGGGENYLFYASRDLIHWEKTSEFNNAGGGECPDLFQVPLDGDRNNLKWIFWCGNGNYSIGSFDGKTFKKDSGPFRTSYNPGKSGNDYAAQSFINIPAEDGRHIYMAWMAGGQFPGMPFSQQLTIPRVLTLKTTPDGPRVFVEPVKEIERLRTGVSAKMTEPLDGTDIQLKEEEPIGELADIEAVFTIKNDALTAEGENRFGLEVNGQRITCILDKDNNRGKQKMAVADSAAPLSVADGKVKLRVIVDRMSVEAFANDGAVQIARNFVPPDNLQYSIKAFGKKGLADVQMKAYQLQSIWKGAAASAVGSSPNTRTFTADKRYLIFPRARGKSGPDRVFVDVDGKPFLSVYDAPMSKSEPDFWTYLDLSLVQNKQITVRFDGPNAAGVELVRTSDVIPGKHPLYHEPGRPQVHFSPLRGWLNDPSGMIYFEGKWHLYYANTRFANVMAGPNNAWGHAVSSDLLHWEEAPLLLNPVRGKYSFWTGGAAVDVDNTTGLGRPGKPALVLSANNGSDAPNAFTQCVFPSIDGGMSVIWNPDMLFKPLPKEDARRGGGTRDPMILWYAPEKKWVLVVYNQSPGGRNGFHFFESRDLKGWQETGVLDDMYECPNLFELPVDGNPANRRWVTWGSDTAYHIGTFNGRTFIPEGGKHRAHHGAYSASQVFANAPGGRIVQIGWAHVCDYDTEFTQMASFPLELSLKTTPDGVRLFAEFVPELAGLRGKGEQKRDLAVKPGAPLRLGDVSRPMEVVAEFEPAAAARVTLEGPELGVAWHGPRNELEVNGQKVRLAAQHGVVRLHLLLDIPSVEVVSNGGESYLLRARNYQNLRPGSPLEIEVEGGDVLFRRLEVYPLRSIQPGAPD